MFGENESETPRRPSPWRSLSDVGESGAQPSTSCSALLRPSTLAQFIESQMKGLSRDQRSWRDIEPEVDADGHIEYKLRILAPSPARFEKLTTQLKWRLLEGGGTALYEIGVLDDGTLVGLEQQEMEESLYNLSRMANQLNAYIELVHVIELPEILIHAGPIMPDDLQDRAKFSVFSQLVRGSCKPTTSSERKERGRQKKKKKKARSKSVNSISSIARVNAQIRAAPGDSAVSSDSEPTNPSPALQAVVSQHSPALGAVNESRSPRSSSIVSSLECLRLKERSNKRWSTDDVRSPRQIERVGGYLDQISAITPEERGILRRTARKERRMKAAEEARRSKAKAKAKTGLGSNLRPIEVQESGMNSNMKSGIKYVVEVKVFKTSEREEGSYLDFEGFGTR
ncbi:hypothetical protein CROQUDRAFT_651049 [Cronartium quercuum f. sp. fusiforme G11]|uniref:Uncharacterized protein n=1 Tax=Cronartium quercuum f. sp. fusiforme G11 TaxID=708437 RepID=A0A9P6TH22_9BASI|nr:hypothetical protein CROQUDRAFT_651049 [Cronartium quercuum f. sp. fusiforme G11]